MKKTLLKYSLITSVLSLVLSCGGGDDDEVTPIDTTAQTQWQFDDFKYNGGASSQITTDTDMGAFGVLVVSTDEDESNGEYSGSALTITYAEAGAGNYLIVSQADFVEARNQDASAKVIVISCTVGSARIDATLYDAVEGGSATITIDNENRYHIGASNIALEKVLDVNQGVPNAPETGTLTITNAFDFSN